LKSSKVTAPAPVGLTRPLSVATSEMFWPTVAVCVALVERPGVAFSTVVFSPLSRQAPSAALLLASPE
jgi:hypothetical protein